MNYMIMDRARYEYGGRNVANRILMLLDLFIVTDKDEFTVIKNRLGPVGSYPASFLPHFLATNVGKEFSPHDTRTAA